MKTFLPCLTALLLSTLFLTSCSDFSYYVQCANGHWDVMSKTRPIEDVINDPRTSEEQKLRLSKVLEVREFAVTTLALPDNDSYRKFADIGRPYVVWNVVAAPEFSLEAKQWCFPIAGCVAYRGYYAEAEARAYAEELKSDGYEVDVYGVQAYSTLNWFDDPVLNTFLSGQESVLAGLIFHELAHQVLYVEDDSHFNEAFAKVVEREGVRRWLRNTSDQDAWDDYQVREDCLEAFVALLLDTKSTLEELYAQPLTEDEMRSVKQAVFADMLLNYQRFKDDWQGYDGFDLWFERDFNNARLASLGTYRDLVPAFQGLLEQQGGHMLAFYAAVRKLSGLPKDKRLAQLNRYVPVRQAMVVEDQTSGIHAAEQKDLQQQ